MVKFTVKLLLKEFFSGRKSQVRICITENMKTVRDLEQKIKRLYKIPEFYLLHQHSDQEYHLPLEEPIDILSADDEVLIVPDNSTRNKDLEPLTENNYLVVTNNDPISASDKPPSSTSNCDLEISVTSSENFKISKSKRKKSKKHKDKHRDFENKSLLELKTVQENEDSQSDANSEETITTKSMKNKEKGTDLSKKKKLKQKIDIDDNNTYESLENTVMSGYHLHKKKKKKKSRNAVEDNKQTYESSVSFFNHSEEVWNPYFNDTQAETETLTKHKKRNKKTKKLEDSGIEVKSDEASSLNGKIDHSISKINENANSLVNNELNESHLTSNAYNKSQICANKNSEPSTKVTKKMLNGLGFLLQSLKSETQNGEVEENKPKRKRKRVRKRKQTKQNVLEDETSNTVKVQPREYFRASFTNAQPKMHFRFEDEAVNVEGTLTGQNEGLNDEESVQCESRSIQKQNPQSSMLQLDIVNTIPSEESNPNNGVFTKADVQINRIKRNNNNVEPIKLPQCEEISSISSELLAPVKQNNDEYQNFDRPLIVSDVLIKPGHSPVINIQNVTAETEKRFLPSEVPSDIDRNASKFRHCNEKEPLLLGPKASGSEPSWSVSISSQWSDSSNYLIIDETSPTSSMRSVSSRSAGSESVNEDGRTPASLAEAGRQLEKNLVGVESSPDSSDASSVNKRNQNAVSPDSQQSEGFSL